MADTWLRPQQVTLMCLETFFFFIFYFITVKNLPTINNSIMKIRWSTISTILKSSKSMAKFWIKRAIHLQWKHKALPPSQHMGVSLHLVQTWICNYTPSIWWDIIAYPCPRVNGLIGSKGHPDPFSGWDSEARKDKGNLSEIYLKLTHAKSHTIIPCLLDWSLWCRAWLTEDFIIWGSRHAKVKFLRISF